MPYPMVKMPTFGEFLERVSKEFGCEIRKIPGGDIEGLGELKYLERQHEGQTLQYGLQALPPLDERMTPSLIRSICRRLQIDPAAFGLKLG